MATQAKILKSDPQSLEACAQLLRDDALVAVPTETVYGLAGNALSVAAVRKIFSVKGRPLIDPLITHFKHANAAFSQVYVPESARALAAAFWPGPLTLVLKKRPGIPDLVTAGLSSAAIRVPNQPVMLALLQKLDFPLAAPSANPFGYVSPTRPEHVARTLGHKIGAILDGGHCQHGIESTILDLRDSDSPRLLRPGPIPIDDLASWLDRPIHAAEKTVPEAAQTSPGQLTKHYSPRTKLEIVEHGQLNYRGSTGEAVVANNKPDDAGQKNLFWLAEDGNLETVARNLFDLIQKLDHMQFRRIVVEAAPESGIGIAINDRLRRAAAPS